MKFYWPESTQINERIQFSSDFVRNDGLITTELERTLEGWVTTTRVPKLGDLMHDRGRAEVIIEIKYTINVNVFNSSPNHLPLNPQFSSVAQSCLTFRNPMDHSNTRPPCPSPTPRVYSNSSPLSRWCHPTIASSVIPFNLSQHQGLFKWLSSLHQMAKVLEFQLQHQSFQWTFRTDFF